MRAEPEAKFRIEGAAYADVISYLMPIASGETHVIASDDDTTSLGQFNRAVSVPSIFTKPGGASFNDIELADITWIPLVS